MLSFVACLVYVAGTYLGNHPTPDGTLRAECMHWIADATALVLAAIVWSEYFFGVAFSLDYLLHLFIAENKMVYVFSWGAAVDLLAIFPVFAVGTETSIGFLVSAVLCCARHTLCNRSRLFPACVPRFPSVAHLARVSHVCSW